MFSKGDAFWCEGHVWIVLSDPSKNDGKVLLVNLTTLDDDCPDDECILNESHFAFGSGLTVIARRRASSKGKGHGSVMGFGAGICSIVARCIIPKRLKRPRVLGFVNRGGGAY